MSDSPRLTALFALAYDAIRLLRDGLITPADMTAIHAAINARIAVAREEASHAG